MPQYFDGRTGLPICDSNALPLAGALPSREDLDRAIAPLILSASGWRKVFASSGDEEDAKGEIGQANAVLACHMADAFANYVMERSGKKSPIVALALDSRPTGPAIADILLRVLLARGVEVRYAFIASAPEIMAYARGVDAFAYVSASHNPIGHNGVKFGLSDGGVIPGSEAAILIAAYKKAILAPDAALRAKTLLDACPTDALEWTLGRVDATKGDTLEAYRAFTREVVSGMPDAARQDAFFNELSLASAAESRAGRPVSLVADFNGSARATSIDRAFFESMGMCLSGMHEKAREITHRIVPEGESLSYCAREIERLRSGGSTPDERNASLGYVPDCDGDRGNIVYWNEKEGCAKALEAQEVFALSVIAELSDLVYRGIVSVKDGKATPPVAVAVNDPTSLRIEAIAKAFGASVLRAEVGEANVVNLAREARSSGSIVRILGEGSNGGNITHPSAVRDPLNTVCALLKLLVLRGDESRPGLFRIWLRLSEQADAANDNFTLADIIATLPAFVTTSVFEKDAMLKISTTDHAELKRRFQRVFLREWEAKKDELMSRHGFASWVAIANNGTRETRGIEDFGASGKGGLKVQFLDFSNSPAGFIWLRGSGTEPVFRILADAKGGDARVERELLAWLTRMVLEADAKIL